MTMTSNVVLRAEFEWHFASANNRIYNKQENKQQQQQQQPIERSISYIFVLEILRG